MKTNEAEYYKKKLGLFPHPEGGYFKEVYRSSEEIAEEHLPERYNGKRSFGTLIYYLLENEQRSNFHILKSDEIWHHLDGDTLEIHTISQKGEYKILSLGKNLENNELPQIVIPQNTWFGANLKNANSFALIGCTVLPGFEFTDFELAERQKLLRKFPELESIILKLTK